MGTLLKTNGEVHEVTPANGKEFTLTELQTFVGGYIEMVPTISGRPMFVNSDGKRLALPANQQATTLAKVYDIILGDVIICDPDEVS